MVFSHWCARVLSGWRPAWAVGAILPGLLWAQAVPPSVPPAATELSAGLMAVGGGEAVRVVWLEDANDQAPDPFGDAASYRLAGWDSADGGARRLLELRGNWSRPMLSSDGAMVVFTDRGRTVQDKQEVFDPVMLALDWGRGTVRRLGRGHAVDVRRDAASGIDWVYFIEDVVGGRGLTLSGNTLGKFPLEAPDRREVVWAQASMAVDNLQVSRDGTKFVGLFAGREAALVDVPSGRWHKLATGCWPSLAPDDSYLTWVFDGPHRNVRMFAVDSGREWKVSLAAPPEVGGAETFHPRWSNHPRVITFTGPFAVPKSAKGKPGNPLRFGARAAEVFVARLNPGRDRIERHVRVTHNALGDFFPDVWVRGGEQAVDDGFVQRPALAFARAAALPADGGLDAAVFRWLGQKRDNVVPSTDSSGGERACLALARGLGRLSAHHGLWLDGGWFEADAVSAAALARGVRKAGELTLAFTITEWADRPAEVQGVLVTAGRGGDKPFWALVRRGARLEAVVVPPGGAAPVSLGGVDRPLTPGRAVAVAFTVGGSGAQWYLNGDPSGDAVPVASNVLAAWPEDAHLFIGAGVAPGGGWRASLEEVAVHPHVLAPAAVRALAIEAARTTAGREWPVPVAVRGRLVAATAPDLEKLDTYERMLVDHVYEVVSPGSSLPKRISVLHWAVLDSAAVPGLPREEGREYDLLLDPYEQRPELDGELTDISSDDYALPMFLDVATPVAPAGAK